jgi:hypothetical protein
MKPVSKGDDRTLSVLMPPYREFGSVLNLRCSGILVASLPVKILCRFQVCGVFYSHSEKAKHADAFSVRFVGKVRFGGHLVEYTEMPVNGNKINELSPLVPIVKL